jgi:MFS family permease
MTWLVSPLITVAQGPLVGIIYDHYGPRGLLLGGSLLHVFGVMMTSLGKEYYQILLAQGVCSAIGVSAIFQPGETTLSVIFSWKTELISYNSLYGCQRVVHHQTRRSLWYTRHRFEHRRCRLPHYGLAPDSAIELRLGHAHLRLPDAWSSDHRQPDRSPVLSAPAAKAYSRRDAQAIGRTRLRSCHTRGPLFQLRVFPAGQLPPGRLSTGAASDKLGAYNVFVVVCSLSGVWILALWLTSSSAGAVVAFAILFGFSSAAYVSLLPQLIMAISPKNFADIGWRTGILFLAMAVGGFTTNPINGAIVDGPGGWKGLKIFSGIFCIVGAFFVCVVRMRRAGWKVWVKI